MYFNLIGREHADLATDWLNQLSGKNFRTAPYLIMHVHLTGDTLNNKAPYMDV